MDLDIFLPPQPGRLFGTQESPVSPFRADPVFHKMQSYCRIYFTLTPEAQPAPVPSLPLRRGAAELALRLQRNGVRGG